MLILLLIWLAVTIGLIWVIGAKRGISAGLPLAYFFALSLIHVPGAILYVGDEELNSAASTTKIGFEETIYGMVAFLMGVVVVRTILIPINTQGTRSITTARAHDYTSLERLALRYITIGGVVYFLIMSIVRNIASVTALVAPLGSLIMIGACLRLWVAQRTRAWKKFWVTLLFLPTLPLATLVQGGFLGFGTSWALAIMSFVLTQRKWRASYVWLLPLISLLGLSLFVNYMAARDDLRRLVWSEQASISERLGRVVRVFEDFAWLDFSDARQREAIDNRLNQNFFIGVAVTRLQAGEVSYEWGSTFVKMIPALVPRALWPNKPIVGGGGTVVKDVTGLELSEGTSFGAGQVLEFYVNFGRLGVILGFFFYGCLLAWLDLRIMEYLGKGDQKHFMFLFLIALSLLQPGGNLLEIGVGGVAATITGFLISRLLSERLTTTIAARRIVSQNAVAEK